MVAGQGEAGAGNVGRGQMRAADTDRDRAVSFLTNAYTEGRLGKDEYDTRLESALSARTYADLDRVVTDLPGARVTTARPVTTTNGLAVASLACGLAQFAFGPLPTIPAIVLGHVARHQIKRTGEQGAGMALAGLLLGWAAVVLGIIAIAGLAVFAVASSSHAAGIPNVSVHPALAPLPAPPPAP
jgi:uncharacterized protein DUF1707/uncharacterized protein DUF4190